MKVDELKKDEFIIEWLDTFVARNASKNTVSNYLFGMQFYTDCLQKTPSELIQEATDEYLIKFVKHLKEKKLAPMAIRTYFNGIKSFYNYYDIELPPLVKKIDELMKDEFVIEWLDALTANDASDKTIRNYLAGLQFYTECLQKTPKELILETEAEFKAGLSPREQTLKKKIIKFLNYLQARKLAPMSIRNHMSGVKSFYKHYEIALPASLPKAGCRAETLEDNKPIPTKDDLRAVLKVCDPLERAILLVGASSGLPCEDIINLKVRNFKDGYESKTEITTMPLRRIKTKVDFITFLTPEASRAVWDYLESRDRTIKTGNEERQPVLDKQKVYSNEDYLFIGRHIPDSFLETRDDNERWFQDKGLVQLYYKLSEKAKKNTAKGRWNLIRSHIMRSYFDSVLKGNGCDSFHVEFWLGHKMDNTKSAYFRANPENEKELFKKYIPFLTIQKALDVSESPDFQRIKNENQALVAETVRNAVERQDITELKEQLEGANQRIIDVENDYRALQADSEFASTVSQHYVDEAVQNGIAEFKKELLGQSQGRIRKNMKEPPIDFKEE